MAEICSIDAKEDNCFISPCLLPKGHKGKHKHSDLCHTTSCMCHYSAGKKNEAKAEYVGKVLSLCTYAAPTRSYRLGYNCDYPQHLQRGRFSFSHFLSKFEGKTIRLTLEVIEGQGGKK